jgi:hypothetical protein
MSKLFKIRLLAISVAFALLILFSWTSVAEDTAAQTFSDLAKQVQTAQQACKKLDGTYDPSCIAKLAKSYADLHSAASPAQPIDKSNPLASLAQAQLQEYQDIKSFIEKNALQLMNGSTTIPDALLQSAISPNAPAPVSALATAPASQAASAATSCNKAAETAELKDKTTLDNKIDVDGKYSGTSDAKGGYVRICVNDVLAPNMDKVPVQVGKDGNFDSGSAGLKVNLGDKVVAQAVTTDGKYGPTSNEVAVGTCSSTGTGDVAARPTLNPVKAGDTNVSGTLANAKQGTVRVCVDDREVATAQLAPNGIFATLLSSPLEQGQSVSAQQITTPAATLRATYALASAPIQVAAVGDSQYSFDFGRVRVNLTGGAILSQDQGQFSKTSTYLDLNTDSTWFMGDHSKQKTKEAYTGGAQLNTFFNVRLTALPATTCPQSTSGSGDNTGVCAAQSGSQSNLSVSTPKAALVAAGVYVPIYFRWSSWQSSDGHRQALYLAPIAKGGFQTLVQSAQSTNGTAGGATPPTTTTTPGGKTFFHFAEFGGRFGLYKFHDEHPSSVAPDQLLYLDIAGGSYENFPAVNSSGTIIGHPWRLSMEGRLMSPYQKIPVFIGFNSNTRPGHGPTSAPGDLRFLFGIHFDVGCLLQTLKVTNNAGSSSCDTGSNNPSPTPATTSPASTTPAASPKQQAGG